MDLQGQGLLTGLCGIPPCLPAFHRLRAEIHLAAVLCMRYWRPSAHLLPANYASAIVVQFEVVRAHVAAEAASVDAMFGSFCVFAKLLSVQKQTIGRGVTKGEKADV
jgi:hypothetical protein